MIMQFVSAWTSRTAFNSFMRTSGVLWQERGLGYCHQPPEYLYVERSLAARVIN